MNNKYILNKRASFFSFLILSSSLMVAMEDNNIINNKSIKFEYFAILPLDIQKEIAKLLNFMSLKNLRLVNKKSNLLIKKDDFKMQLDLANKEGLKLINLIISKKENEAKVKINLSSVNLDAKNNDGYTPLILASYYLNEEIVKLLIERGANVNLQDKMGNSPLMMASAVCSFNKVKLLIDYKANLNLQDEKGITALDWASEKGCFEIVKLLIESKVNVNLQAQNGNTALISVLKFAESFSPHHYSIIKLLVDSRANLNLKDSTGSTALIYASKFSNEDLNFLLRSVEGTIGSNFYINNKNGKISLDSAKTEEINNIVLEPIDQENRFEFLLSDDNCKII